MDNECWIWNLPNLGELGLVAGFSMHDWESRDDEMILLVVFTLDDI